MLPLVAIAILGIVQVSLLVWDQLRITHAAREGARVLAVTNDESQAVEAALAASDLDPELAAIDVDPSNRPAGGSARISIEYEAPVVVPFLERLVPRMILRASATMRVERDPP